MVSVCSDCGEYLRSPDSDENYPLCSYCLYGVKPKEWQKVGYGNSKDPNDHWLPLCESCHINPQSYYTESFLCDDCIHLYEKDAVNEQMNDFNKKNNNQSYLAYKLPGDKEWRISKLKVIK